MRDVGDSEGSVEHAGHGEVGRVATAPGDLVPSVLADERRGRSRGHAVLRLRKDRTAQVVGGFVRKKDIAGFGVGNGGSDP
jgi:hypothetical protein